MRVPQCRLTNSSSCKTGAMRGWVREKPIYLSTINQQQQPWYVVRQIDSVPLHVLR